MLAALVVGPSERRVSSLAEEDGGGDQPWHVGQPGGRLTEKSSKTIGAAGCKCL